MNLVLSTVDRNTLIVQETIDKFRFLYFVYNPETTTMEARLVSDKENVTFKFDTSEAMSALGSFMIECKDKRKATLSEAIDNGKPYPKNLESALLIEEVLPEVNKLARKEMEELKLKYPAISRLGYGKETKKGED